MSLTQQMGFDWLYVVFVLTLVKFSDTYKSVE